MSKCANPQQNPKLRPQIHKEGSVPVVTALVDSATKERWESTVQPPILAETAAEAW